MMWEYRHLTHIHVPPDANLPPVNSSRQVSLVTHFYIRAWAAALSEFVEAINDDRDPSVTGEDGVRVLEVTDAVFQSGRTGETVPLGDRRVTG
jgi:predicted dehydrogenase